MSDPLKHECGIAMLRLLKPMSYYKDKYGSPYYGIQKMQLLMEKQRNRGQDGAGIANIKFDTLPGERYISRYRSSADQPIKELFQKIYKRVESAYEDSPEKVQDLEWVKKSLPFTGELFLGHLRYGTYGGNSEEHCHPFLRQNNWKTRNLVVAGNFNLTNVDQLFDVLVDIGQHPKEKSDTITVLEKIGHYLDEENQELYDKFRQSGYSRKEISNLIAENIDLGNILRNSAVDWDGGYVMSGLLGHGDAFVLRDPAGIRPVFYYQDEEIVVVTSERPVIQTAFNVKLEAIQEIAPGEALFIRKNGTVTSEQIKAPLERRSCSFERIYFSRGNDAAIYKERKQLGVNVIDQVLKALDYNTQQAVFSFIPNTAEVSFYGLVQGMERYLNSVKQEQILALNSPSQEQIGQILQQQIRVEKIAIKDAKLRTFITEDSDREDLVAHVYDVVYGVVKSSDTIVVVDDSIVRGTTLKQSILKILDRLGPKNILIVSAAPQIRYPDCYGIDMARLNDFIAFKAAISLLRKNGKEALVEKVYKQCKAQENLPYTHMKNYVKQIYDAHTVDEITSEIAVLLTPSQIQASVKIVYQSIEGLRDACPESTGDWYFTGDYPTDGGNNVLNRAFIYFYEGKNERAY